MTRAADLALAVLVLALICASASTHAADAEVGAATARLVGHVEETGDRVYWSCGTGACVLSIALNARAARSLRSIGIGSRITRGPPTQAWLLKADGSHISPLEQRPTEIGPTSFRFPVSARDDAFAVVVRIDRKLHTWWMAERETDPGKQGSATRTGD